MMRSLRYDLSLIAIFFHSLFQGCEFEHSSTVPLPIPTSSTLVINEVFTLPLSNQNTFSWIEILNPTRDTIRLFYDWTLTFASNDTDLTNAPKWTITLATNRYRILDTVFITLDSTGQEISRRTSNVSVQQRIIQNFGYGIYEVPFGGLIGAFGATGFVLPPGGLLTFVNNEQRLESHTRWGDAGGRDRDGRYRFEASNFSSVNTVDTIRTRYIRSSRNTDSLTIREFRVVLELYSGDLFQPVPFLTLPFYVPPKGQLWLRDPNGTVVDVVRMGDSVYTNVMGDSSRPLLSISNRSAGRILEYESLARYAGGYFTANTANDFYFAPRPPITSPPTPHAYNPLTKY